jgi:hypothetical protein
LFVCCCTTPSITYTWGLYCLLELFIPCSHKEETCKDSTISILWTIAFSWIWWGDNYFLLN